MAGWTKSYPDKPWSGRRSSFYAFGQTNMHEGQHELMVTLLKALFAFLCRMAGCV